MQMLRLVVEDDGRGMPETSTPKGTGLGQKVIAAMARSLSAVVRFDPDHNGARAVLAFEE
jgi:two-component sensor histidine kinase